VHTNFPITQQQDFSFVSVAGWFDTVAMTSPIDAVLLATRREDLLARAARHEVDAVLVFGHGSGLGAGTRSHGALRYLSDWDGYESSSLLVFTESHAWLLVASPFLVPLARLRRPDLEVLDVRPAAWGATIAQLLGEDLRVGTIGFDEMPCAQWRGIDDATPAMAWVDVTPELDDMRLIKDAAALALHRAAAGVCDELFHSIGTLLPRGVPAWQIQAMLEGQARAAGAEYCRTWLTVAPQADYPRYWREECTRVPQAGDQVLFGVMLMREGHWGHGIRMGAMGPLSAAHRALWQQASEMLEAGLAALSPGRPLAGAETAMHTVLARHHDAAAIARMTRFRNGHGLGCSYEEPLSIDAFPQHFDPSARVVPAPAITVAAGMVFELHPNLFVPGVGGAALGEMVEVGPVGARTLLSFPREPADWS
jgi:Xaa-Pro aminopeptidase